MNARKPSRHTIKRGRTRKNDPKPSLALPMSAPLQDALEGAYRAFARVPCPSHMDASPLRDGEQIHRVLTSAPLRDLTAEQIGPYSGWAVTTVGPAQDYRHFLPRILELALRDPVWLGAIPAVIAEKLMRSNWRSWAPTQQRAIVSVFESAFMWAIEQLPDDGSSAPDAWLCGMASLNAPIMPLLSAWMGSPSPNAALQLSAFIESSLPAINTDDAISGPFCDLVDLISRQVAALWLRSQGVQQCLKSAIENVAVEDRSRVETALRMTETKPSANREIQELRDKG